MLNLLTVQHANAFFAKQCAETIGVQIRILDDLHSIGAAAHDAIVIDLDSVDPAQRRAILDWLLGTTYEGPVAVHSYNLEEEEALALNDNGILTVRQLTHELLWELLELQTSLQAEPTNVIGPAAQPT